MMLMIMLQMVNHLTKILGKTPARPGNEEDASLRSHYSTQISEQFSENS